MIILHNPHDKVSRNFVALNSGGNEVLNYPECMLRYPNVSAFPSVVLNVPKHKFMDDLTGEECLVEAHEEVLHVLTWSEVEEKLAFYEANRV